MFTWFFYRFFALLLLLPQPRLYSIAKLSIGFVLVFTLLLLLRCYRKLQKTFRIFRELAVARKYVLFVANFLGDLPREPPGAPWGGPRGIVQELHGMQPLPPKAPVICSNP